MGGALVRRVEDDEYPELSNKDLEGLPANPAYQFKKKPCIQCGKLHKSEHRFCSFGLRRIEFLCKSCKRKMASIVGGFVTYSLK